MKISTFGYWRCICEQSKRYHRDYLVTTAILSGGKGITIVMKWKAERHTSFSNARNIEALHRQGEESSLFRFRNSDSKIK